MARKNRRIQYEPYDYSEMLNYSKNDSCSSIDNSGQDVNGVFFCKNPLYLKNRKRRINTKKKNQKRIKMSDNYGSYESPIMIEKEKNNGEKYHVRASLSSRGTSAASYFKRYSNQRTRGYIDDIPLKGNFHKKIFDLWWTLY